MSISNTNFVPKRPSGQAGQYRWLLRVRKDGPTRSKYPAIALQALESRVLASVTPVDGAGNSMATARDLGTLNSGLSVTGFVGLSDAADFYRFVLSSPTTFNLTMNGLTSDADVQVLSATGSVLGRSVNGGITGEAITLTLNPGTYFANVFPYIGSTNYTLTLHATPVITPPPVITPVDGAGNSMATARNLGTLSSAISVTDSVGINDTSDFYGFALNSRTTFSLTMNGLTSDADVQVLSATGSVLGRSVNGGSTAEAINLTLNAGNYFIKVFPYIGTTNYILALHATPALGLGFRAPINTYPNTGGLNNGFGEPNVTRNADGSTTTTFHTGVDLGAPVGTNVYAIAGGQVVFSGELRGFGAYPYTSANPGYGGVIIVRHINRNGIPFYVLYGHLNRQVAAGTTVQQGQVIGTLLDFQYNGRSTPHLHLGVFVGPTMPTTSLGYSTMAPTLIGWRDPIQYLAANM